MTKEYICMYCGCVAFKNHCEYCGEEWTTRAYNKWFKENFEVTPEITRNDIMKEDFDCISNDCLRIEAFSKELRRYVNGLLPDAVITQGRFFSMGELIKDLNKHWNSIVKLLGE